MLNELTIVIPCYNEKNNLDTLLEKFKEILNEYDFIKIILVDNGSTDKSDKIIKNNIIFNYKNFKLIQINKNIGYGHGIIKGLEQVDTEFYSWTHADLQTDIKDVVKAFKLHKEKLITGNYIIKGKRKKRNLLDSFFTICMSFLTTILTLSIQYDINAQPKIFTKEIFNKLKNPPNDFMLDLYFMIIIKKLKFKIINFPVYFSKRKFGISKGGGTIKGKLKLSILTIRYLLLRKYKN